MAHYAELNENNEVIYVIYLNNETITDENGNEVDELGIEHLHKHHGKDRTWVRTSYGGNFRGKYAEIGDSYMKDIDIFASPQPYPSWILNKNNGRWEPPIPEPEVAHEQIENGYNHYWDEAEYQITNKGWVVEYRNELNS